MTYEEWLQMGLDAKFISTPWCYVHSAPELTDEEHALVEDEDGDMDVLCIFSVRLMPGS